LNNRARPKKKKSLPQHDPNDRTNWVQPNEDRSKCFPLPAKYSNHVESGISTTIPHGDNTFDFELK
jgi:hypothetical protein